MNSKHNTTRFTPNMGAGGIPAAESSLGETGVHDIWASVRGVLKTRLGGTKFDAWIASLELIAEVGGEILIAAESELASNRVTSNFGHLIQNAWNEQDAQKRIVSIEARGNIPSDILQLARPEEPKAEAGADVEDGAATSTGDVDDVCTLNSYLVGDSNRSAFGLVKRLVDGLPVASPVVSIVGPHGVGKSHLLKGIRDAMAPKMKDGEVLYLTSEEFMVAFVDGIKAKDTSRLREMVCKAKVLLLDDLQFITSKPGTLTEFFARLRANVQNGGVVIMSCDRSPAVLELESRMRDEILGGVVVPVVLPDLVLRKEIVRAKADAIAETDPEFVFPDAWVDLVAERLPMSGRALYGVVRNVFVSTRLGDEPLTLATVEKAIQLQLGGASIRAPKIDTIKDVVAKTYGVTKADLESPCRKRCYALPRQYAMYLSRKLTECSYPQIGGMFGRRDHTTVLFAYKKIHKQIEKDEVFAEELRQLEQQILTDPRNFR